MLSEEVKSFQGFQGRFFKSAPEYKENIDKTFTKYKIAGILIMHIEFIDILYLQ